MRGINSDCIDLIYLDPPFNSNRTYEAPIGSKAAGASFKDAWTLDDVNVHEHGELADRSPSVYAVIEAAKHSQGKAMMSYLIFMALRIMEMKRTLKETGSIYLHCDPTASHYLKLLMDGIFSRNHFRNEIIWCYKRMASRNQQHFSKCHDVLLYYSKSSKPVFNPDAVRLPCAESSRQRAGYRKTSLGGAAPASGVCELNKKGRFPEDWWDIPFLRPNAKERTGYPTQKPLALLDRIIKASSNPGDMVLDPFCGCATSLVAADRLGREWVGIDLSSHAIRLVDQRIKQDRGPLFDGANALTEPPNRTDQGKLEDYKTHKHTLFGKQEGVCNGCGIIFLFKIFEVDHMLPKSRGGNDHIENLQLLCLPCNRSKGKRTMAEWKSVRDW